MNRITCIQQLKYVFCVLGCVLLAGCDDGKIYPEEDEIVDVDGGVVTLEVAFKNLEVWPDNYMFLFATYGEDERTPIMSKIIPMPSNETEKITVYLNGITEESKYATVAVSNRGRQLLYKYYTYAIENPELQVVLPVEEIDLAGYDRVQQHVFNTYCILCHGEGNEAAAGLYLTEGKSLPSLVNHPSALSAGEELLVKPGSAGNSFLVDILENDILRYNHTDVLPEAELITLIETWINNGATEK